LEENGISPDLVVGMGMNAVSLLVQQRLIMEATTRAYPVPVHLIPPPCPISVTSMDFSQTADLIERASETTAEWLEAGHPLVIPHIDH